MPPFQFDVEDCSLIVSALVHYAGDADRTDDDALHAHDLVQAISRTIGLAPSELVRRGPREELTRYRRRP